MSGYGVIADKEGRITVYKDKSFDFITKVPPVAVLIKKSIKIEKNYVVFQNTHLYSYGYKVNDLVYVFNGKEALDNYQYNNAVYDVIPVSDRWYYGTSYAYGSIF